MNKHYNYNIDLSAKDSPSSIISELKKLSPLLLSSDLAQVVFFNRAYLIITQEIHRASLDGLFEHPQTMDKLEQAFAKRYFAALNSFSQTGALPKPWNRINRGFLHRLHPSSLSLMIGASAHINSDLPVALRETITDHAAFKADFFRVSQLLLKSSHPILQSYYEADETMNFIKLELHGIYLGPVMKLVLYWRKRAWRKLMKYYLL